MGAIKELFVFLMSLEQMLNHITHDNNYEPIPISGDQHLFSFEFELAVSSETNSALLALHKSGSPFYDTACKMTAVSSSLIPQGYIFHDAYNSNDLCFNLGSDYTVESVKSNFIYYYSYFIQCEQFNVFSYDDITQFHEKYDWLETRTYNLDEADPSNLFTGYLFKADLFFNINKTNTSTTHSIMDSNFSNRICKYYSLSSSASEELNCTSKYYNYANLVQDIPICSHPSRSDSFAICSFSFEHKNCNIHSFEKTLIQNSFIESSIISDANPKHHFSFYYSPSFSSHDFYVYDNLTSQEVSYYTYATSQYTYEQSLELALDAWRSYSESFVTSSSENVRYVSPDTESSSDEIESTTSYISSILSL